MSDQPLVNAPSTLYFGHLTFFETPAYVWLLEAPDQFHMVSDIYKTIDEVVADAFVIFGKEINDSAKYEIVTNDEIYNIYRQAYAKKYEMGESA